MLDLLVPEHLAGIAGAAGLVSLAVWRPRSLRIAVIVLTLAFLALVAVGSTAFPGSPVEGAPWAQLVLMGGTVGLAVGGVLALRDMGVSSSHIWRVQVEKDTARREVDRLGGINVRLEDEVRDLRGRLAKASKSPDEKESEALLKEQRGVLVEARASERRHRAIFECAFDGMAMLEQKTLRVRDANKSLCRMTGHTKEELRGLSLVDLFGAGDDRPGKLDLQRSAREGRPLTVEILRVDQTTVTVEVSCSVAGRGKDLQLLTIMRDVSERQTLQRELEHNLEMLREREQSLSEANGLLKTRADKIEEMNGSLQRLQEVKDHVLSSVAHELRTPLTSIRSFSEILLKHGDSDPEIRGEFLEIIHKESERLTRLVNNVLDLGKIESGKTEMALCEFEAADVMVDAIESMSGMAADRGITVVRAFAGGGLLLFADRDKIQQLAMNLLANAFKFSPDRARVEVAVTVGSTPDRVEISVRDHGVGIAPEDLGRIFEKYRRVGELGVGGTGLGLSICQEIASLHGARIWVESTLGDGSVFRVEFPGAQESRARLAPDAPAREERPRPVTAAVLSPLDDAVLDEADDIMVAASPKIDAVPKNAPTPGMAFLSETGTLPPLGGL